jgi:hypothetical protein
MKRVTGIIIALAIVFSVGMAKADDLCCLYGCGVIKGVVKLCGSFIGQEGAIVTLGGRSVGYFSSAATITDATGYYEFRGDLPVCYIHAGTVTGTYFMYNCCGKPNEVYKASSSWRFRSFNQGELITLVSNLKLLWAGYF